jgi:hypothetical protein
MLGSIVVVGAMVFAACGDVAEESGLESSTTAAPASTTSTAPAPTTTPDNLETEEGTMSDTLDPAGSVTGGNVVLSYPGDTYPPELSGLIGLATTDLAGRLGVDESTINVALVEEVTWSDASLGCPDPDMSYAQVITDGLRILLESNGAVYDYRSGGVSDPALCEQKAAAPATPAATYEITEEGEVVPVTVAGKDGDGPTEGHNPPDE